MAVPNNLVIPRSIETVSFTACFRTVNDEERILDRRSWTELFLHFGYSNTVSFNMGI